MDVRHPPEAQSRRRRRLLAHLQYVNGHRLNQFDVLPSHSHVCVYSPIRVVLKGCSTELSAPVCMLLWEISSATTMMIAMDVRRILCIFSSFLHQHTNALFLHFHEQTLQRRRNLNEISVIRFCTSTLLESFLTNLLNQGADRRIICIYSR